MAIVQTSSELVVASGASGNITFGSALTAGNAVVILIANLSNSGNNYTATGYTQDKIFTSGNSNGVAILSQANITGGSTTVALSYSGGVHAFRAIAFELSNVPTSSYVDVSDSVTDSTTSAPSASASGITTTGAAFIVEVFSFDRVVTSITKNASWTSGAKFTDAAANSGWYGYRVATGTVTSDKGTISCGAQSPHYNAAIVAYKMSAGSAGPTINTQPSNQSVAPGATFTFTVSASASGGGTLSYQWQKNGTNISGATSASYSGTANTDGVNGDAFRCVCTETGGTNAGSVNSNAATLTVTSSSSDPIRSPRHLGFGRATFGIRR